MGTGRPVTMSWRRRSLLAAAMSTAALSACRPAPSAAPAASVQLQGGWVGASHARGHRLRESKSGALPAVAVQRRARVLVLGAGVAGLAAARAWRQAGVDDVQVLELEDSPGGNARGHRLGGMACPLGAHYLPLPVAESREVAQWLFELGLLRHESGRTVPDPRHLCHSPQERLFIDGQWVDGSLPPAAPGSATLAQYRLFGERVAALSAPVAGGRRFALPAHRAVPDAQTVALDRQTFASWLAAEGLDDRRLLWYLDYACRDDYGAGLDTVSAWAGLHYFASRHGFHATGDEADDADAVFTWPEGNGWLTARLAAPLQERLHGGRTVLRVAEGRHGVDVVAWDEATSRLEGWTADTVICALPLFVAARLFDPAPPALREAAAALRYAPWLVANLHIDAPLLERQGVAPAWDNVIYGSAGLGYVDAMHQSLRAVPGATVLTAYHALPMADRGDLLKRPWTDWAERVLQDLDTVHPDLRQRLQRIEMMRYGHAMAVPVPGLQDRAALQALRAMRGRVRFAHADLAGYSVFEEAFVAGCESAAPRR